MLRYLNLFMCGAFGLSAILQYNDPDPIIWIITYGTATFFAISYQRGMNIDWKLFGIFAGITFMWGVLLFFNLSREIAFLNLFEEFTMKDPTVEIGRESGGLFLISLWTAILTFNKYRN